MKSFEKREYHIKKVVNKPKNQIVREENSEKQSPFGHNKKT